jgi:hypothetical protein
MVPVSNAFNYAAPAELFFNRGSGRQAVKMSYRRFPTAAEAIAFAVEELGVGRGFATLQVDDARFERATIQRLYEDPAYPLLRHGVDA